MSIFAILKRRLLQQTNWEFCFNNTVKDTKVWGVGGGRSRCGKVRCAQYWYDRPAANSCVSVIFTVYSKHLLSVFVSEIFELCDVHSCTVWHSSTWYYLVFDTAIFVLKRDVKLQLTWYYQSTLNTSATF